MTESFSPSASLSGLPSSQDGGVSTTDFSGPADISDPSEAAPNDHTKERIETVLQSEVRIRIWIRISVSWFSFAYNKSLSRSVLLHFSLA